MRTLTLNLSPHAPALCPQDRCLICFDSYPLSEMRCASCKQHFFCKECWRGYISSALGSGPACLDLRCPSTECKAKACVSAGAGVGLGPV